MEEKHISLGESIRGMRVALNGFIPVGFICRSVAGFSRRACDEKQGVCQSVCFDAAFFHGKVRQREGFFGGAL